MCHGGMGSAFLGVYFWGWARSLSMVSTRDFTIGDYGNALCS